MRDDVVAVYLTFPDEAVAERVARLLVAQRLAACVNLLPAARSVYRWEAEVRMEPEVVGIAKTGADRVAALVEAVRSAHPFDLPCVVAYPAVGGLAPYLSWVVEETRPEPQRAAARSGSSAGDSEVTS